MATRASGRRRICSSQEHAECNDAFATLARGVKEHASSLTWPCVVLLPGWEVPALLFYSRPENALLKDPKVHRSGDIVKTHFARGLCTQIAAGSVYGNAVDGGFAAANRMAIYR